MTSITAGLYTQVQNLKKRLKKMDTKKRNQKEVKEIVDALNALEERYAAEKAKRLEKQKAKAEQPKEVEAANPSAMGATAPNAVDQTTMPGSPEATPTTPQTPDDQKVSCPLCGGITFPDQASYQQHMQYTHASDIMPTTPGQKLDKTVAAVESASPEMLKREELPTEKAAEPKFKLDDDVRPIRMPNGESKGKVMRWDGKPTDLVYVAWESGPLKERDGFGGYDAANLSKIESPHGVEAEHKCPDCDKWRDKETVTLKSDLRTNYDAFLKDLKEERDIHYIQGNNAWVARLDQKIEDLKKAIGEKFPNEKTAGEGCTPRMITWDGAKGYQCMNCGAAADHAWNIKHKGNEKQGGAQNAEELTVVDHTPAPAVSSVNDGGESKDEFQDENAMPLTSAMKITIFDKEFLATPLIDQKKFGGYDISLNGKKLFNIGSKDSQPMTKKQLEFCAQIELTRGLKQAKLTEKIAFLEPGTKIFVVAEDKARKHVKFASLDHGVRGWIPASKVAFMSKKADPIRHGDHIDDVLGSSKSAYLCECPNGSGNMVWLPMGELLPIGQPPATPESLNDLESAKTVKCVCGDRQDQHANGPCSACKCPRWQLDKEPKTRTVKEMPADKVKRADLGFPLSYFARPEAKQRAEQFGLIDVEDGDLTSEGLAAKKQEMLEGHDVEAAGAKLSPSDVCTQCQEGLAIPGKGMCSDCYKHFLDAHPEIRKGADKKCDMCGGHMLKTDVNFCSEECRDDHEKQEKRGSKECPDCHGTFEGAEGETCPTCGRFAVQKTALQTALPPQIVNQRGDVNATDNGPSDEDVQQKVWEMFKQHWDGLSSTQMDQVYKALGVTASLNKIARVVHREDGWHVLSEKGKNLGGPYKSKGEAVKRLRQVEYFKHNGSQRPFCKKEAETMANPYQSLTDHITDMRSRMTEVQQSLSTVPAIKTAEEQDNSTIDLPTLFADLTQGVELLETKLGGDESEHHEEIESLENKLWTLEEKLGLTPEISEEEKVEPEHKEVVEKMATKAPRSTWQCLNEDCGKKFKTPVGIEESLFEEQGTCPSCFGMDMDKTAGQVTDETIVTNNPNFIPPDPNAPTVPSIKNVQPTDDNLEIPTQMPTSPLPPGQKWVWDAVNGKFVAMTDSTNPGKII
ncbi:MAG: hypothetical protein ACREBR_04495 [bacterium]